MGGGSLSTPTCRGVPSLTRFLSRLPPQGYAAHLVLMISKYQQVPLRYRIVPLCSRTVIVDDISDIAPSKAGRRYGG